MWGLTLQGDGLMRYPFAVADLKGVPNDDSAVKRRDLGLAQLDGDSLS